MKKQLSIRTMTSVAVLSAVAFVLAFFEFPVPLSPSFARMDLSDFPALIGAFAFGPVAGILIELVKNLLGLFSTATSGVGDRKCRYGHRGCACKLLHPSPAFRTVYAAGSDDCILRSVYPIYQNKAGCCSVQCIPVQLTERPCNNRIHNARI